MERRGGVPPGDDDDDDDEQKVESSLGSLWKQLRRYTLSIERI